MLTEFAPAKLNLYLHITGRRADGYHDLDSLVAFAGVGDELHLEGADEFAFEVTGPQAGLLNAEDMNGNLVVKAARSLAELTGHSLKVKLTLVKNLPVASGIGGGSSDAAAALRALARHWGMDGGDPRLDQAAIQHGQDVPVCLRIENNYITANGTAPAPQLPVLGVVLINPNLALSTPAVYKKFREGGYGFTPAARLDGAPATGYELIDLLKARTNDLYAPALALMPEIGTVITALEQSAGSLLTRMSGSGATCFALYENETAALAAANELQRNHQDWWVATSKLPYL